MRNLILLLGLYYLSSFLLVVFLWDLLIFDYYKDALELPGLSMRIVMVFAAELPKILSLYFCTIVFFRLGAELKTWLTFVLVLIFFDFYLAYLAGPSKVDNSINNAAFFLEILLFSGYLYKKNKKQIA